MRNAILNQHIQSTSPAWFDEAEAICNAKTHSPQDTPGNFSITDTDSIKPIDKRARKGHGEYTKDAHALDEE